jgi:hypothetical protein
MSNRSIRIPLTRNGSGLRLTIPTAFMRQHGLKWHDQVAWIEDAEGVRLKFIKIDDEQDVVVGVAA